VALPTEHAVDRLLFRAARSDDRAFIVPGTPLGSIPAVTTTSQARDTETRTSCRTEQWASSCYRT
jgi:hypothetical protein